MKLLAALLCIVLPLTACASPDESAISVEKTSGVVMQASPDLVWAKSKQIIMSIARNGYNANEGERIAKAFIGPGGSVTVKVEPRDASGTRTILRVAAQAGGKNSPDTAEKVTTAIQQAVLREQ
jgi:ABC-type glycerol-3-phosphate transport system substrate-binding protein